MILEFMAQLGERIIFCDSRVALASYFIELSLQVSHLLLNTFKLPLVGVQIPIELSSRFAAENVSYRENEKAIFLGLI